MKARTTLLNLLFLYLAAGRVLAADSKASAKPPKHDPFDSESDGVDEEDEESSWQTGRLPLQRPGTLQGTRQSQDPPPSPWEDSTTSPGLFSPGGLFGLPLPPRGMRPSCYNGEGTISLT
jgi:hypothetical protein